MCSHSPLVTQALSEKGAHTHTHTNLALKQHESVYDLMVNCMMSKALAGVYVAFAASSLCTYLYSYLCFVSAHFII